MSFENTSPPRARMFLILLDGPNLDHPAIPARAYWLQNRLSSLRVLAGGIVQGWAYPFACTLLKMGELPTLKLSFSRVRAYWSRNYAKCPKTGRMVSVFFPFLWTQEIHDGHRTGHLNDGYKQGTILGAPPPRAYVLGVISENETPYTDHLHARVCSGVLRESRKTTRRLSPCARMFLLRKFAPIPFLRAGNIEPHPARRIPHKPRPAQIERFEALRARVMGIPESR